MRRGGGEFVFHDFFLIRTGAGPVGQFMGFVINSDLSHLSNSDAGS